ncbi:hypothetical protein [Sphingobium sp. CR28]|uniref:hypothetical protein n=1 Tax=Sphingobium sp. CR28 TaxID=3400272 RepID=UPI003FEF4224
MVDNKSGSKLALAVKMSGTNRRIITAKSLGDRGAIFIPIRSINMEKFDRNININDEHVTCWINNESGKFHLHHTYNTTYSQVKKIDYSLLSDSSSGEFAIPLFTISMTSTHLKNEDKVKYTKYDVSFLQ